MHLKYTEAQLILPRILNAVPKILGYNLSLASLVLRSFYLSGHGNHQAFATYP